MTVFNLGSINADQFYRVPHLPAPGETLAASAHYTGLGGKGANQSVAASLAGARVVHIGAVGADGDWAVEKLQAFGVDTDAISQVAAPTAHAIITVDDTGENAIVIFSGANMEQSPIHLESALSGAVAGDILLLQNETSLQGDAARAARAQGMFVIYSAAPFDARAVQAVMSELDLLVMNEVEAAQLARALGVGLPDILVPALLITRGSQGAIWRNQTTGEETEVPAFQVDPVDTTGAGDCFIGYVAAGLDQGLQPAAAMRLGAAASAIQVTRPGTADAIPTRAEVDAFLAERGTT